MTKNTRRISISGPRYRRVSDRAASQGTTIRSLVEPRLIAMLDAADAAKTADDALYPPTPKRCGRNRRRFNRPVPGSKR